MARLIFLLVVELSLLGLSGAFGVISNGSMRRDQSKIQASKEESFERAEIGDSRRSFLLQASLLSTSLLVSSSIPAEAAVGTLPELANANAVLQGVTIRVADQSQQKATVSFFTDAFDFKVLRQRIKGTVEETWLGYGPEQLSIPSDCTIPVSSFGTYGGHASIHLVYDSKSDTPLYRSGDAAPGDNIAYLQVAVPGYRISKMTQNNANIVDAYGFVSVISPAGLPIRGIVGIAPDPIMFIAINCADVKASQSFYEQLGFVEQEYPYSRPSKGLSAFEPSQPPKSVYMGPSPNGMGVLLLSSNSKSKRAITTNPVFESLNVVYTPSEGSEGAEVSTVVDPSGAAIAFQSVSAFEKEERVTR
jgi:catechol 2,3-dioxygenase-like lactoylglutathione lyase family enzyme